MTFVEKEEDGKNQINTLVNSPNDVALILQMFRSNYEACKMALESLDDEDVKKYGADVILKTIIDMGELKNVHKMFLV